MIPNLGIFEIKNTTENNRITFTKAQKIWAKLIFAAYSGQSNVAYREHKKNRIVVSNVAGYFR
ncbi:hypothetical protein [Dysgonomonas alginatilytica]|uniref:hypothetical protein n=1 Tax=Dysgonomonas alginatilytica TaxID=1605892 RepID=UPI001C8815F5|nr:hypothetical protein [Dysgonomonas alginatilytica]